MIKRQIEDKMRSDFNRKKIIVVMGARQVGKTTLLEAMRSGCDKSLFINCDDYDDAALLEMKTSTELRDLLAPYDMVQIDEAQRVRNIGLTLKIIGDLRLNTHIIVTGSSSFDLSSDISEPATGRLIEYNLYPFSLGELAENTSEKEEQRMLQKRLVYGMYPEVVTHPEDAKRTLMTLANSYLYKDILAYKGLKKPELLQKLVRALALQLGSEVSYNELSNMLGIDKETVENYISLLEKYFVVFRLSSYSRNMRNEIKKGKKVYFYDNGIRNAVLSNFAPPELRTDMGALWENFMVSERKKRNAYHLQYAQLFFWRTHDKKEIDLIEEEDGLLRTFEFKWGRKTKASMPAAFNAAYPQSTFEVITPDNYWKFIR